MNRKMMRLMMMGLLASAAMVACGADEEEETPTPDGGMTDGGMTDGSGTDGGMTDGSGGGEELSLEGTYFADASRGTVMADPLLGDPTNLTAPNFVPAANSPAAGAGVAPTGAFFTATDYIGAFEPGGEDWTAGWTAYAPNDQSTPAADATFVDVGENITADTTWTADNVYRLTATIYVVDATLTIEPGTLIVGNNGSALVITSTAMIMAQGTAAEPIVFTSSQAPANRVGGDWGGVVMLGSAPINVTSNNIEGLEAAGISSYGGSDSAHNCGTMSYVRIEYAGFTFGTDNELNSLTLGGCGSATSLDHIQTSFGLDDGIEFFGGNANLKYAVVSQTGDDSLDWDQGFSGNIQFFVAQQSEGLGDRTIEADNLSDNPSATPISNPTVYNATLIGGGAANTEQLGMKLRVGTRGQLFNFIVMNFGGGAVDFDGDETQAAVASGDMVLSNFLFFNAAL